MKELGYSLKKKELSYHLFFLSMHFYLLWNEDFLLTSQKESMHPSRGCAESCPWGSVLLSHVTAALTGGLGGSPFLPSCSIPPHSSLYGELGNSERGEHT